MERHVDQTYVKTGLNLWLMVPVRNVKITLGFQMKDSIAFQITVIHGKSWLLMEHVKIVINTQKYKRMEQLVDQTYVIHDKDC